MNVPCKQINMLIDLSIPNRNDLFSRSSSSLNNMSTEQVDSILPSTLYSTQTSHNQSFVLVSLNNNHNKKKKQIIDICVQKE